MMCLWQDLYDESQTRAGALERQSAALQVEDDDEDEAEDGDDSADEDAAEGDADDGGAVDEWWQQALR